MLKYKNTRSLFFQKTFEPTSRSQSSTRSTRPRRDSNRVERPQLAVDRPDPSAGRDELV